MATFPDEKRRIIEALEDAGVIVHQFTRERRNDLGGVELDVALTIPTDE